jgi:glycopeptide antibiotics resistance protein
VRDIASRQRTLLTGLFVVYLLLLTWMVLWKLALPWVGEAAGLARPWKLVPFVASGDAGASAPLELLANLLLFVPFGLYLGALAPAWRWWMAVPVFVGASLALEATQHLLSTGSFDTTDVIVNALGGIAGFAAHRLLRKSAPEHAVTRVFAIGTAVAVLAVAAFIVSPLRYEPVKDFVVPGSGTGER